jgi:HAD superfamily hydrolase (TIGR01509 family)
MTINYVFWDSDNTLVKTYNHHWNKHFETLKALGINLGEEYKERIYTNNGAQNWEWLITDLGLQMEKDDYLNAIDSWYYRHIENIEIREGVLDALDYFDGKNIPMAVVSNGRRRSVMAALEAKNLAPRFKFILCIEDYEGRKPSSAPYLAAKTKMQQIVGHTIDANECLVIEDDPKGVQSGLSAGMKVIDRPINDTDTAKFLENLKTL